MRISEQGVWQETWTGSSQELGWSRDGIAGTIGDGFEAVRGVASHVRVREQGETRTRSSQELGRTRDSMAGDGSGKVLAGDERFRAGEGQRTRHGVGGTDSAEPGAWVDGDRMAGEWPGKVWGGEEGRLSGESE